MTNNRRAFIRKAGLGALGMMAAPYAVFIPLQQVFTSALQKSAGRVLDLGWCTSDARRS